MKSQSKIEAIVKAVIDYLEADKSIDLLPEIANQLIKQSWTRYDPNLATVYSSIKLSPEQTKELKQTLTKLFNRPVRIKHQLDRTIIAGMKIDLAGQVIDATVNRKLEEIRQKVAYD